MADQNKTKGACHACRSRKTKCSKELPKCFNCQNCGQACVYPTTVLKPGPKLGSVHKRRRVEDPGQAPLPLPYSKAAGNGTLDSDVATRLASPLETSASTTENTRYFNHVQTVSELWDPSHQDSSPGATGQNLLANESILLRACIDLGVSFESMKEMSVIITSRQTNIDQVVLIPRRVGIFFDSFTTFGLFREPQFFLKLARIHSTVQLKALLAAIFAFSCKSPRMSLSESVPQNAGDFADIAVQYVDTAISLCGDETPPLCVLQALILATHWLTIRRVRGRAWRYVGICIRLAFEMELHCTDADRNSEACGIDSTAWCADEERRRAYWAVWEMDQYTNHMKHIAITLDWTQYPVYLPAEDEKWFRGEPHRSCVLEADLIDRSKSLKATGSMSARAWYVVVASLDAEAYELAYPREKINRRFRDTVLDFSDRWQALFNAIQLSLILLPQKLAFNGQYLDFGTHTLGVNRNSPTIQRQSLIYQIALLPEIARMFTLRLCLLDAYKRKLMGVSQEDSAQESKYRDHLSQKVRQCYQAADAIFNVVTNCHTSHHQYVNPYITHASWLAATVQLLHEELSEDESQKKLARSKFEILKATNDRFIQFWEMSTVAKHNLDDLDTRLKQFCAASKDASARMRLTVSHDGRPGTDPPRPRLAHGSDKWGWNTATLTANVHGAPKPEATGDSTGVVDNHSSNNQIMLLEASARVDSAGDSLSLQSISQRSSPISALENLSGNEDFHESFRHLETQRGDSGLDGPPDRILDSTLDDNIAQSSPRWIEPDPVDWTSFFIDGASGEEWTDYVELFSAPYPT